MILQILVHAGISNRVKTTKQARSPFNGPQSNRPLYSNTVICTLAVDGWVVIFGTAAAPPNPLLAVPNVTAHPSTVGVPTSFPRGTIIASEL